MDRAPRDAPPASSARSAALESGGTVKRITAAIRFRPAAGDETGESAPSRLVVNGNTVRFNGKKLRFDHILPAATTQEELYNKVVSPLVQTVLDGQNASILAYGQTGAGKTYTMGFSARDGFGVDEKGVVDRFFDDLFARIQADATTKFTVRASHMQILGKDLEDLLGSKSELKIVDQSGVITVSNLTQQAVHSAAETAQLLRKGCKRRRTATTDLNAVSSRSHSIFTLYVSRESSTEVWAKVSFVDLAGSERCKTKPGNPRFAEGVEINTALSVLGNVIGALAKGSSHVPFRNHSLTRILQNDLGGNSRVIVIACVSPASVHHNTTIQTIEYVGRVMKIKAIMTKNLVPSRRSSDAPPVGPVTGEHTRTNEDLFAQLQSTTERADDLTTMTSAHRAEIAELRNERIRREERVREVEERFAEISATYERVHSLVHDSRVEVESLRIRNRQLEDAAARMIEVQNERDALAVKHASVVATQNECFNMFNEDLLGMRRRERELEERCAELSASYERTRGLLDSARTEAETLRTRNRQLEVASARTAVEQASTVATQHERFNMLTEDLLGMREREQHAVEAGRNVHGLQRHERVQVLDDMLAALETMEKDNLDVDGFQSVVTAGIEARIRSEMHDFLSQGGSQCDLVALSSRLRRIDA